jgi:transposase-like protein
MEIMSRAEFMEQMEIATEKGWFSKKQEPGKEDTFKFNPEVALKDPEFTPYIKKDFDFEVVASKINKIQFYYKCPYCFDKVKKDGTPYKNAKNKYHCHGSGGNLNNRVEYRVSHCINSKHAGKEVKIIIDDTTFREK